MNLEDFNKLSDEEKSALLSTYEKTEKDLSDREAEVSSLKTENDSFKETITKTEEELKKTKELNYTLARNADSSKNRMSFEDALHGLMKGERKNDN